MLRSILAAFLLAVPADAGPFSGRGYLEGCDGDAEGSGCRIVVSGVILLVRDGGGTNEDMMDLLWSQPPVTAVAVSGERAETGGILAPLVLTSLSFPPADPFQETLRALQGDWRRDGGGTAHLLRIVGLEWQDWLDDEPAGRFLITPSEVCADGTAPGGMVVSLRAIGGDPEEAACWQVEAATGDAIVLRGADGERVGYSIFED